MKRFFKVGVPLVLALMISGVAFAQIQGSPAASTTHYYYALTGFCDTFDLTLSGSPKVYVVGVHSFGGSCGLSAALDEGFYINIPSTVPPQTLVGKSGNVLDVADSEQCHDYGNCPCQDSFVIDTSNTQGQYALYETCDGANLFVINEGPRTTDGNAPHSGMAAAQAGNPVRVN